MRPMLIIGGSVAALALTGVLALTRFAPAQQPPPPPTVVPGETMTISVPEVEVRSGPSKDLYPTNKLRNGEQVTVVTKTDQSTSGWLAIKPPRGSISFISTRFVRQVPNNPYQGVVQNTEPVDVFPATMIPGGESSVSRSKLQSGSIVMIRGAEISKPDGTAVYPIDAPDSEVRYIPENSVARTSSGVQSAITTAQFVPPPGGDQSLLAQADAKRLDAIRYYQMAAQSSDPNQKRYAQYWLTALQQTNGAVAPTTQPGYPFNTTSSGSAAGPKVALGGSSVPGQTTGASTAMYTAPTSSTAAQWTKWGTLKKTAYQGMYRLEDKDGSPLGYAMAAPGLTLEPYVSKFVCLYGTTAYRSDDASLRVQYTVVSQLSLPPDR